MPERELQTGDTVYLRYGGNMPYTVLEAVDERGPMPQILVRGHIPSWSIQPTTRVLREDILLEPETNQIPPRSADTMSDAIAMSSPSGRTSERARKASNERLRQELFGPQGLQPSEPLQPPEQENLLRKAQELRELASRGMHPRSYLKEAQRLEAMAARLSQDGKPSEVEDMCSKSTRKDSSGIKRFTRESKENMKDFTIKHKPGMVPASECDPRSFRMVHPNKCTMINVCCPKGKYNNSTGRCKVGLEAHRELKAKKCQ